MVNDCIRTGLEAEKRSGRTPSMKQLSLLSYGDLKRYPVQSQYRLTAISKAAGILSARSKSIRRGFPTRSPYQSRAVLVSCYDLTIWDGHLLVRLSPGLSESIPLNSHTLSSLSDPSLTVRSLTLTQRSLSLCVSKEVKEMEVSELSGAAGVDRNLRNLTVGNQEGVTYYDISKVVEIADNTRSIVRSFKRNDVRVRQSIASKYGKRRKERVERILHAVSKEVVEKAKTNGQAIVFEEIRGIRKLYRKGTGQGRNYRSRMHSWPFHAVKRQVEYKAAWEGVPVITLSRSETRGTTTSCPRCGERLQWAAPGDAEHYRQLWCERCGRWIDRDLASVLNISRRGWLRFDHSTKQGEVGEAMVQEREQTTEPLILRVDASKLRRSG
jgi:putative transposase